jgi:hypothetical protein
MITNNTTIETLPFNGLWLSKVLILNNKAHIVALPYNGEHVLVNPATRRTVALSDSLMTEIRNAVQRRASTQAELVSLDVNAPSPDRAVLLRASFKGIAKPFLILDVYKVMETDEVFAQSFNSIMYQLGQLLNDQSSI